ncbi:phosphopantothenoylcysteine decarboxylase subunit SIS2-like [Lingula anatina]|uniref:Phosphopantothenoylcysteine decarboxylase subunit SIS2-like n=1 Tax=Lingula anatina TaxID=7574 RepID=A0A1S3KBW5_LINAN|nr:phosphopantothenoylcysteine decarboxylase subunit SIS2-like [Lingula anatina]|eukprot:XP_013419987.1 phosphopantothenoylcysteine decarboxylase subunit SIS2-like [Lingula anatina]
MERCLPCAGKIIVRLWQLLNWSSSLPASSAENERAFNRMKLIKTAHRSNLSTSSLDNLMTVHLLSKPIRQFNPDAAIDDWFSATSRHPTFRNGLTKKSRKLQAIATSSTSQEHEIDAVIENEEENIINPNELDDEDDDDDDEGFGDDDDEMMDEDKITKS